MGPQAVNRQSRHCRVPGFDLLDVLAFGMFCGTLVLESPWVDDLMVAVTCVFVVL